MGDFRIQFNGRETAMTADDDLTAARRTVMEHLLREEDAGRGPIARGRSYPVTVNDRAIEVDVAIRPGRGSVTAKYT